MTSLLGMALPKLGASWALDWCAVCEMARWDSSERTRELVERAYQPDADEIVAAALLILTAGELWRHGVDESAPLGQRVKETLEAAAAALVRRDAIRLGEEEECAWRAEQAAQADAKSSAAEAILAALGSRCEMVTDGYGGFGSIYLRYRSKAGYHVEIRVSDHEQKVGGGWNEGRGERMGESDLSYLILAAGDCPERGQVRRDVAQALAGKRD